jgi:hypothetical protein
MFNIFFVIKKMRRDAHAVAARRNDDFFVSSRFAISTEVKSPRCRTQTICDFSFPERAS